MTADLLDSIIGIDNGYDNDFDAVEVAYYCNKCGPELETMNKKGCTWVYKKVPKHLSEKYEKLKVLV